MVKKKLEKIKPNWCFRCICGYKGRNFSLFEDHTDMCNKFSKLPKYQKEALLNMIFDGW